MIDTNEHNARSALLIDGNFVEDFRHRNATSTLFEEQLAWHTIYIVHLQNAVGAGVQFQIPVATVNVHAQTLFDILPIAGCAKDENKKNEQNANCKSIESNNLIDILTVECVPLWCCVEEIESGLLLCAKNEIGTSCQMATRHEQITGRFNEVQCQLLRSQDVADGTTLPIACVQTVHLHSVEEIALDELDAWIATLVAAVEGLLGVVHPVGDGHHRIMTDVHQIQPSLVNVVADLGDLATGAFAFGAAGGMLDRSVASDVAEFNFVTVDTEIAATQACGHQ